MQIVLGSQSPRRRELLSAIVDESRLRILPPDADNEPGFDGLPHIEAIEEKLRDTVVGKHDNVFRQLQAESTTEACLICADTIVVVTSNNGQPVVLGKPPSEHWQPVVRDWFQRYYSGRRHEVWTCFLISTPSRTAMRIVKTGVHMPQLADWLINWYLATGESVGKAGGYGIQGQAAMLVSAIDGSLSNVIGLPVFELINELQELDVKVTAVPGER